MKKSDFEYVLSLLRQYAGWDLSNDKYFIIDKKLYNFICEKGYASVEDLIAELKIGQKAMLWQVVEALTLSDTYFYRDYPVFKAFENYLLPQLREINRSSKKLRIYHHNNVASLGSLFDFHDLEVLVGGGELRGFLPVGRAFAQTNDDVDAALGQVFGVGVALGTKTDDSNRLAVENAEVAVGIIILVDSHGGCLLFNVEFFYF